MENLLKNSWKKLLQEEMGKDYFIRLKEIVNKEYSEKVIYPDYNDLFRGLNLVDYKDVKVFILGQDPYHGKDQANGLAFSVKKGTKIPPSLRNIYKELESDLGIEQPEHGDLTKWAEQGVLLLNTVFTVEEKKANSHKNIGWELFTDKIISLLNEREEPVIFVLWGNQAKNKEKLIDKNKHHIITSPHPSPLSAYRGFFGSKPFSKINNILEEQIDWDNR